MGVALPSNFKLTFSSFSLKRRRMLASNRKVGTRNGKRQTWPFPPSPPGNLCDMGTFILSTEKSQLLSLPSPSTFLGIASPLSEACQATPGRQGRHISLHDRKKSRFVANGYTPMRRKVQGSTALEVETHWTSASSASALYRRRRLDEAEISPWIHSDRGWITAGPFSACSMVIS